MTSAPSLQLFTAFTNPISE